MKKIICAVLAICCLLGVTACGAHEHNWNYNAVTTLPTCGSYGVRTYRCDCGAEKTERVAKTEHAHSEEWLHSAGEHWQSATCGHTGERVNVGEHAWDEGVKAVEDNCQHAGLLKFTCTVCGETKSQSLAQTGHSYSEEWSKNAEKHWRECSTEGCNAITDEGAHKYGEWQRSAQLVKVCKDCGDEVVAPVLKSSNTAATVGAGEVAGFTMFTVATGNYKLTCITAEEVTVKCAYLSGGRFVENTYTMTAENGSATMKLVSRVTVFVTVECASETPVEIVMRVTNG